MASDVIRFALCFSIEVIEPDSLALWALPVCGIKTALALNPGTDLLRIWFIRVSTLVAGHHGSFPFSKMLVTGAGSTALPLDVHWAEGR